MRKEDIELIQNVPKQPRDEKGRFIGVQDHIYMPRDKNGRFTKLNNKQIEINKQLEIYRLYWHNVSNIKDLPESFIRKHQNKLDWNSISYHQNLPEDFIREFSDRVYWYFISKHQTLSEDFIREFSDKVDWYFISCYQTLSEDFIREFSDKVDWDYISKYQTLSKDFIREFSNKVSWNKISCYQTLSEGFIREFSDKVDWDYISKYQTLSEDFIIEFSNKVDWDCIFKYQKLSEDFIKNYKNKINKDLLKNNWMYKNNKFKLKYLKKIGIYEILDDKYIIAYKSCRKNGSSIYNHRYNYKVGNTYKSNCDCNVDNKNSFGLSAWTREKALDYCKEKLLKVKINIEDIGCIVHNNSKIRCYKLTVLEEIN